MASFKNLFLSSSYPISTKLNPKITKTQPNIISASSMPLVVSLARCSVRRRCNHILIASFHAQFVAEIFIFLQNVFSNKQQFKEISCVLRDVADNPLESLVLIDALQRLSLEYHFQEEIEAALYSQHKKYNNSNYSEDKLYEVSTRFRLLRQEGYNVNSGNKNRSTIYDNI